MRRKILMTKEQGCVWTYLLEEDEIVEIHCTPQCESDKTPVALGNIYIGRVDNIVANIGAAFIDIGGINCYYDLSQAKHAIFTHKAGKKALCIGDELVVQISKEAVKTKAPTVSSNISFTGRYAVLTSGNTRIGASAKIPRSQRDIYKERLQSMKNEEYGIIVRTNAKEADFETVLEEIHELQRKYEHLREIASYRTCFSCLAAAEAPYITDLKNVYAEEPYEVVTDDHQLFKEVEEYFHREQPEQVEQLRLYEDPMLPMSKLYNLQAVLERALNERVWLKHGGYLVIQPTEALTVVDVNSGKCIAGKKTEETYLKINLEAAKEIAKQLRLRNLSGIIIVDFINLEEEENRQQLLKEFRKCLLEDPIQATVADVTALQLVEVTRKKVRKPLYECWRLR